MRRLILLVPAFFCSHLSFSQNIPNPKPTLKKGEYLNFRSVVSDPKSRTINPAPIEAPGTPSSETTSFKIFKTNGRWILRFQTKNSQFQLSRTHPITIQLMANLPLQVQPSVILSSDWPKGATEIPISITGVQPGSDNLITGRASYTYCHITTKACKSVLSSFQYFASP